MTEWKPEWQQELLKIVQVIPARVNLIQTKFTGSFALNRAKVPSL